MPEDTTATTVPPTSPAATKRRVEKSKSRTALEQVFEILGRPVAGSGGGTVTAAVPAARVRVALEEFAQCATFEELDAKQVNLKLLARDLFDWHGQPGGTRATGNVVKAMARALMARDEDGTSRYCQAVEMFGLASAVAPLLQPDRLARLIDQAPTAKTAFGPDRYTLGLSGNLRTVLARYPEQRREQLLVTLWEASHDGRWWDITAGVRPVQGNQRRRGHNREQRAADNEILAEALNGVTAGTDEAHTQVTELLLADRIPYTPGVRDLVASLPASVALRDGLVDVSEKMRSGELVYPDKALLISAISWAAPNERPESPIGSLVRSLTRALAVDPETGEALLESLPDKPKSWAELYPQADLARFPHPKEALRLDGTQVAGTTVEVELVKNAAELYSNGEFMGNCTVGYKDRMEMGAYVLFRLWDNGSCYNASIVANAVGDTWRIGEVNSRFNAGNVPETVRAVAHQIAAMMPPREQTHFAVAR